MDGLAAASQDHGRVERVTGSADQRRSRHPALDRTCRTTQGGQGRVGDGANSARCSSTARASHSVHGEGSLQLSSAAATTSPKHAQARRCRTAISLPSGIGTSSRMSAGPTSPRVPVEGTVNPASTEARTARTGARYSFGSSRSPRWSVSTRRSACSAPPSRMATSARFLLAATADASPAFSPASHRWFTASTSSGR
jgi:hypothetical protein